MNGPERAQPTTKEPAQDDGQYDGGNTPQQAGIQRARAKQRRQTNERVQLDDPVNGPSAQLPPMIAQCGNDTKPDEQEKEKDLRDSASGYDFHVNGLGFRVPGSRFWVQSSGFKFW
jgi:hypothetical protein